MFAPRVKEITTSTGAGDLALAGAVTNFDTFSVGLPVNVPFRYFVIDDTNGDWEDGVGHLSNATTLVRDKVYRSTNSNAPVVLGGGTKTVICDAGVGALAPGRPGQFPADTLVVSTHYAWAAAGNGNVLADYVYFTPFLVDFYQAIDSIGVGIGVASGSKCRLGIYTVGTDNLPDKLIAQTGDVTPATASFTEGSITTITLPPGWYYLAFVSNGADQVRFIQYPAMRDTLFGVSGTAGGMATYMSARQHTPAWTAMPPTAGSVTLSTTEHPIKIAMRIA